MNETWPLWFFSSRSEIQLRNCNLVFPCTHRLETWKVLAWKEGVQHLLGNLPVAKPGGSNSAASLPPSRASLTRAGGCGQRPTTGQGYDSRWRWRRVRVPGRRVGEIQSLLTTASLRLPGHRQSWRGSRYGPAHR